MRLRGDPVSGQPLTSGMYAPALLREWVLLTNKREMLL
jgi:hypothetical protein